MSRRTDGRDALSTVSTAGRGRSSYSGPLYPTPRSKRFTRETLSILIAAASLTFGLVFSGLQARAGAIAQHQAKQATELSLLTQLQSVMTQSIYGRVPYTSELQGLRAGKRQALSSAAYRVVSEEAANLDYFAWLFDKRFVTIRGAEKLWGPLMLCEWKQVFAPALENPARDVPNLLRFVREREPALAPIAPC